MKIYISLPITGRNFEDVESSVIFANGVIEKSGHKAISPIGIEHKDPEDYEAVIGTDITALLCCDAILLLPGWEKSKGCRLEYNCALIYGKQVFYSLEEIKGNKPQLIGKDEISAISCKLRDLRICDVNYIDKLHLLLRVIKYKGDGVPCKDCVLKSISKNYSQCPFIRACTAFSRPDNTSVYFSKF